MNKQEMEGMKPRLARIWQPDKAGLYYEPYDWIFFARLQAGAKFNCVIIPQTQQVYTVTLSPLQSEGSLDYLDGEIYEFDAQKAFLQSWVPVFRRNCWLSGCDVQASAHEKAEWMRDFTSAEIEAWDLKF